MRTPSDAYVGPIAVNSLASIHVDLVFMGVHGMTRETGFTTPNMLEAETGAVATLGYGIALALQGDEAGAGAALRRATELDAEVLARTRLDEGMREVVASVAAPRASIPATR